MQENEYVFNPSHRHENGMYFSDVNETTERKASVHVEYSKNKVLEECQKRENPKDAKKGGARHARGEGGGPKKKEDPGMSEKEKNRSQWS